MPTRQNTRTRIFVIDGCALIREGFKRLIEHHPPFELAGEASDGREASEQIIDANPDVVIVDAASAGLDAVQTANLLRRLQPAVKILALGASNDGLGFRAMLE